MSKSKKKPRVFKITPDNGVIIGASYIGKTIDVPLPAGLAELEGSGPYEIRKKTPEDFILCKPGCKSPECYCIGECQPWTTNSMKHPYSGPTFDYDGPWSTAQEPVIRNYDSSLCNPPPTRTLILTKEEAQVYINDSVRAKKLLDRLDWLINRFESRVEQQTKFSGVLIVWTLTMLIIGAIVWYSVVL